MEGERVGVGLGSNLGRRMEHLARGLDALDALLLDMRRSSIYETVAVDRDGSAVPASPRFLNACCVGRTDLSPGDLLRRLLAVEVRSGRVRSGEDRSDPAARTLDVDLLLYGDRVVDEPGLRVPHPRMTSRSFVLVPLAELAPGWRHPEDGRTVRELAEAVDRRGIVRRLPGRPAESRWPV